MLHIYKIKPRYTQVLVTGNKYEKDVMEKGLIVNKKGDLKLYQTVVAVGSTVRDINPGDTVMFDPSPYAEMKYDKNSLQNDMDNNKFIKWHLPWVFVEDKETGEKKDYLMLQERDISYTFEGEEKEDIIITPGKPQIIVK